MGKFSVDIAIVTGASLAWNPRALSEATILSGGGLQVAVFGASPDQEAREADEALARKHGFAFRSVAATQILPARIRTRASRELFRWLGIQSRWQLGYWPSELLTVAERAGARYYIVHLEQGLWVGMKLLNMGHRVGIDMEDWYSEDLLPQARRLRPLHMLRDLERRLLCNAKHATCPSHAMSVALMREFGCAAPMVVRNTGRWRERNEIDQLVKDRRNARQASIHWFSQTLGLGRGLEDLVAALPLIDCDVEVHLRGNLVHGFEQWLRERIPDRWQGRFFFHPVVPNDELLSRLAEHDIGFAGEMKYCRSRDLTVTNKILQYLLAGLAVVASDTAGQTEVAEIAPQAVSLYPSGDAVMLAARLNELLRSPDKLRAAKAAALQAAERVFCWEQQENALLQAVEGALRTPAEMPRQGMDADLVL